MTGHDLDSFKPSDANSARKPRIALMGEFSAGKSTLLNMLLTSNPLPVRVTATSVPPVWLSHGPEAATRVLSDGTEEPFDLADLATIGPEDTKFIRVSMQADALEICDLFDMPGISDPNMSNSVWQDAFDEVDSVIWCTHATQAWRQSEAATWAEIVDQTNGNNILVITQFDKIRTDRDRARLLNRVKKETRHVFRDVFPLALIDAINAADEDSWQKSGAAAFSDYLVEMLLRTNDSDHDPSDRSATPVPTPTAQLR
ncbi:MAG: dynamin family protein [Pseudomonadota bacterium]